MDISALQSANPKDNLLLSQAQTTVEILNRMNLPVERIYVNTRSSVGGVPQLELDQLPAEALEQPLALMLQFQGQPDGHVAARYWHVFKDGRLTIGEYIQVRDWAVGPGKLTAMHHVASLIDLPGVRELINDRLQSFLDLPAPAAPPVAASVEGAAAESSGT